MENKEKSKIQDKESKPICGIIMPISAIDGCPSEHWTEIKGIISEAICTAGYTPNLVSDADDIGIIQNRIIQNIYSNDIVVCDVSGKNPNVMFELGMRLAFDKPAIIVIDDKTDYSFDTSPIEHLSYPRDLRYNKILDFKDQLAKKIKATDEKAKKDPTYTTFLKNFGSFEVAHVEKKEGSMNEFLQEKLEYITYRLDRLDRFDRLDRLDRLAITDPHDLSVIDSFISEKIHQFCDKEGVMPEMIRGNSEMKDKLFNYLEKSGTIRRMCREPKTLSECMERCLLRL